MKASEIDIVYPVRSGDENEELRYSLRSLSNVPHATVHISGFIPSWLNGHVNRIPVPQQANKYRSAEANLLAAIESDDVSDPFWLFNDDFFMLRKMRAIPMLHRGLLQELISDYLARHSGHYVQGMIHAQETLQNLGVENPLYSYEMHSPILVHKDAMRETLSLRGKQDCYHLRTVYGNLQKLKGKESEDVKVYRNTADDYEQWKMLSTSDILFRYSKAGRFVRNLFPDRSVFEK